MKPPSIHSCAPHFNLHGCGGVAVVAVLGGGGGGGVAVVGVWKEACDKFIVYVYIYMRIHVYTYETLAHSRCKIYDQQ